VLQFYSDEARRERRRLIWMLPVSIGLVAGTLMSVFWTCLWLNDGAVAAGLQGWGLVAYLMTVSATLTGCVAAWRKDHRGRRGR